MNSPANEKKTLLDFLGSVAEKNKTEIQLWKLWRPLMNFIFYKMKKMPLKPEILRGLEK